MAIVELECEITREAVPLDWDSQKTYKIGEAVYEDDTGYLSLINNNIDSRPPNSDWEEYMASKPSFASGPATIEDPSTRVITEIDYTGAKLVRDDSSDNDIDFDNSGFNIESGLYDIEIAQYYPTSEKVKLLLPDDITQLSLYNLKPTSMTWMLDFPSLLYLEVKGILVDNLEDFVTDQIKQLMLPDTNINDEFPTLIGADSLELLDLTGCTLYGDAPNYDHLPNFTGLLFEEDLLIKNRPMSMYITNSNSGTVTFNWDIVPTKIQPVYKIYSDNTLIYTGNGGWTTSNDNNLVGTFTTNNYGTSGQITFRLEYTYHDGNAFPNESIDTNPIYNLNFGLISLSDTQTTINWDALFEPDVEENTPNYILTEVQGDNPGTVLYTGPNLTFTYTIAGDKTYEYELKFYDRFGGLHTENKVIHSDIYYKTETGSCSNTTLHWKGI